MVGGQGRSRKTSKEAVAVTQQEMVAIRVTLRWKVGQVCVREAGRWRP